MHDLVLRWCEQTEPPMALARLVSEPSSSILACFTERSATPVWVAKVARHEASRERLRQEGEALRCLAPWREQLGVPRLLAWTEEAGEACLIQSGVRGVVPAWQASQRALTAPGRRLLAAAIKWLRRMQSWVVCPGAGSVQEAFLAWRTERRLRPDGWPMDGMVAWLADALAQPAIPPVAIHGDFWSGNLLQDGSDLRVVDWAGLAAGSAIEDVLVLILKSAAPPGEGRAALFCRQFFSRTRLAEQLHAAVGSFGLSPAALRFCFYFTLARRLRWEAGFSWQERSEEERELARREWREALAWLEAKGYPPPWSGAGV